MPFALITASLEISVPVSVLTYSKSRCWSYHPPTWCSSVTPSAYTIKSNILSPATSQLPRHIPAFVLCLHCPLVRDCPSLLTLPGTALKMRPKCHLFCEAFMTFSPSHSLLPVKSCTPSGEAVTGSGMVPAELHCTFVLQGGVSPTWRQLGSRSHVKLPL